MSAVSASADMFSGSSVIDGASVLIVVRVDSANDSANTSAVLSVHTESTMLGSVLAKQLALFLCK